MVKRRKSFLLRLAVFVFIGYIAVTLISLQLQISRDRATLASVTGQLKEQQNINAERTRVLSESDEQYMESVARDKLGYAQSDERIFIDESGS